MKKVYETPFTTHVRVEMESAFMKASVVNDEKEGITVEATPQGYSEMTVIGDDGVATEGFEWQINN